MIAVLDVPAETIPSTEGVLSVRVPKSDELARVLVNEPPLKSNDIGEIFKLANRDTNELQKRMEQLAKNAAATIEKVRGSGHSLYLHGFSSETVAAAYKEIPSAWELLLTGDEERSPTFVKRVHTAEGLYLALCEALLKLAPPKGLRLWRALEDTLKVRFNGTAKIPELIHIAMRAPDSAEVRALRADLTALQRCNTDRDLFDIVIACKMHGQDRWLEEFINADNKSDQPWRHKRAAVLNAFHRMPPIDQLQWPEGQTVGSLRFLERSLLKWTNRAVLAKYWWESFHNASDADMAFAAWQIFLISADRRAWVWHSSELSHHSELDRLRELHLQSSKDHFTRTLERAEESSSAVSADKLFGLDAPGKWLMLDGAVAR
jgi:hypothetical protein